jgi:hypothetical protein
MSHGITEVTRGDDFGYILETILNFKAQVALVRRMKGISRQNAPLSAIEQVCKLNFQEHKGI